MRVNHSSAELLQVPDPPSGGSSRSKPPEQTRPQAGDPLPDFTRYDTSSEFAQQSISPGGPPQPASGLKGRQPGEGYHETYGVKKLLAEMRADRKTEQSSRTWGQRARAVLSAINPVTQVKIVIESVKEVRRSRNLVSDVKNAEDREGALDLLRSRLLACFAGSVIGEQALMFLGGALAQKITNSAGAGINWAIAGAWVGAIGALEAVWIGLNRNYYFNRNIPPLRRLGNWTADMLPLHAVAVALAAPASILTVAISHPLHATLAAHAPGLVKALPGWFMAGGLENIICGAILAVGFDLPMLAHYPKYIFPRYRKHLETIQQSQGRAGS